MVKLGLVAPTVVVIVRVSLLSTMVLLFKRSMAYGVIFFCKMMTHNHTFIDKGRW